MIPFLNVCFLGVGWDLAEITVHWNLQEIRFLHVIYTLNYVPTSHWGYVVPGAFEVLHWFVLIFYPDSNILVLSTVYIKAFQIQGAHLLLLLKLIVSQDVLFTLKSVGYNTLSTKRKHCHAKQHLDLKYKLLERGCYVLLPPFPFLMILFCGQESFTYFGLKFSAINCKNYLSHFFFLVSPNHHIYLKNKKFLGWRSKNYHHHGLKKWIGPSQFSQIISAMLTEMQHSWCLLGGTEHCVLSHMTSFWFGCIQPLWVELQ